MIVNIIGVLFAIGILVLIVLALFDTTDVRNQ